VLPDLPPRERAKILEQLNTYLEIKDESLPKFTIKCVSIGTAVHLNLISKKPQFRESVHALIKAKRFNHSEAAIVKIFANLCKTIDKMHRKGICHNAISADSLYLVNSTAMLPIPDFTLIDRAKRRQAKVGVPSLLDGLTYESIDIFHLGLVLLEMLTNNENNSAISVDHLARVLAPVQNNCLKTLL
jgi:serine/threonine protein kinase